jgi:hypothetical protein
MALELEGPSMALATQDENGYIADLIAAPITIEMPIKVAKT